ncbi:YheE family protein [Peribacillus alkalitolerans]|uniref:YheE family protein n=1 Tax=Peribacillus alkalitolerans TaxID=1550385 RepID=UPI0013D63830|nr:YheE family protein [Peribacillus alkalitolerans]
MISHFQWKNLYGDEQIPGWKLSFFFKKQSYQAIYHQNGSIEWIGPSPAQEDLKQVQAQIQELMLFHVYDK